MTTISDITAEATSTKPYLLRALYEWCTDNGFTPYVAVYVNGEAVVPREYVKNGEIVLNLSFDATQALSIGNDALTFKARFSGVARDIYVPIDNIVAIYARENGQGMAFPLTPELQREQALGPKASEAVHGLKLAAGLAATAAEGNAPSPVATKPTASESDRAPTSIKSARSARRPKLATSAKSSAADSVAAKPAAAATTANLSDANSSAASSPKTKPPAEAEASGEPADAPDIPAFLRNSPLDEPTPPTTPPSGRPALKRVK